MIKLNYEKDVDISVFPLPEGNMWREALGRRNYFYDGDNSKKLDNNFFNIFNVNGKVIINRKYGITMPSSKLENGIYYWDLPIDPSRDAEIKNNTNPMVTEEHLLFDFYCNFDFINENENLSEENKFIIKNKLFVLPKQSVINVLERVSDNVSYSKEEENSQHNDILLNGKKVWGEERTAMNTGVYSIGNTILNFSSNKDFYTPTLQKEIEEEKASGKSMTGVEDEIPGYTKEQFIKDYLAEAQRLIDEINSYLVV